LQPISVSSGDLHLGVSVHCDSVVKSESVPLVSSLTPQPVAELVACTVNNEKLLHMDEKLAVGAEQFAVPVTLVFTIAGQHPGSNSGGTSLSLSSCAVLSSVVSSTIDSSNISPSVFCPAIVDVRSLKMEPDDESVVLKPSSALSDQPLVPSDSSDLKCEVVEKTTATSVHCDTVPFHASIVSSCIVTSCCASSSSPVSSSDVSVRPFTSVAGSLPSEMTSTTDTDKSVASVVVKQEFSPAVLSCLSSVKQSASAAPQPVSGHLFARNSTEIPVSRSTQFTDRTAECSETRAEDIDRSKLVSSAKTVNVMSYLDMARVHVDRKKHIYSKTANVDSSVKGNQVPSAAKWKQNDAESSNSTKLQSGSERKLLSTSNVDSKKRKCETTKSGMYVCCCYLCDRIKALL